MPAPQLCLPVLWKMCERPEAWSVWAALLQAFLAAAAIFFAARIASSQERRAVGRRTEVLVERIKQAAVQAGLLKTFFRKDKDEESREAVYANQTKLFEMYAQSLRAVPLENVVDARLLVPLHSAATCCEQVIELLKQTAPASLDRHREWSKRLEGAQRKLMASYSTAFAVQSEFETFSMFRSVKRIFRKLRLVLIRTWH